MQEFSAFLGIVLAIALGTVSPGPSFVVVARTAVSASRADGLAVALGMGAGGVLFAAAALLGLHGLLLAVPSLYVVLKVLGGLYLAYLGIRIWRGAKQPLPIADLSGSPEARRFATQFKSLALGLTTQLSNPKAAIVYASVFAAFLPTAQSAAFDVAIVSTVFVIEAGWYVVVALVLSSEGPRHAYLRYKAWIDRAAGGLMMALGAKLVSSAQAI